MKKIEPITPSEINSYCVFEAAWEDDPLILFHMTAATNLNGILENGFLSAEALGIGELTSVSYAKKSSGCFSNLGSIVNIDQVVIAVKFESLNEQGIVNNPSDIHVYDRNIQPEILGYCNLPQGFKLL